MRRVSVEKFNWYLIVFISSVYLWAVLKYTVDMPFWDDYGAVLGFLNKFVNSDTAEQIKLLFSQHNEHRIVFNRIVELAQFKLIGEVNFLYLTVIGNIGWFLVIAFLWRYAKQKDITIVEFFPIVLIMFSFAHFELMTWAMASLSQYYQILFSLLAIYLLVNQKLVVSFLFMITSIFTVGGGVVLVPVFLLYFIVQKNIKKFILTLAVSVVTLLVYFVFLDYSKPGHHPSITAVIYDPILLVTYVLTFLGNIGKTKIISLVVGLVFLLSFAFIGKKIYKKEPFLFWSILFILAIASVTALSRAGFGVGQALSSRYAIYSLLLVSLLYLSYTLIYKNKKVYFVGLLIGLLSFIFWFNYGFKWLENHNLKLKNSLVSPNQVKAEAIIKKSYDLGVFTSWKQVPMPSIIYDTKKIEGKNKYCIGINKTLNSCSGNFTVFGTSQKAENILYVTDETKEIQIEGWSVDSLNSNSACSVFACIDEKCSPLNMYSRADVVKHFDNSNYLKSGLGGKINIQSLTDGEHHLQIRTLNHSCNGFYETMDVKLIKQKNKHLAVKEFQKDKIVSDIARGYLDFINDFRVGKSEKIILENVKENIMFKGWFIDEANKNLASGVFIKMNDKIFSAIYGKQRNDVGKALKNPFYNNSGFELTIPKHEIKEGSYNIEIFVMSYDKEIIYKTNYNLDVIVKAK